MGNETIKQKRKGFWIPMINSKCPYCFQGDVFKSKATDLKNFNELNVVCSDCGSSFMPEPGFYQISMFFTYAVGVIIFLVFGFATYVIFDNPTPTYYYWIIFPPAIISAPWNLRYSKVFMLYIFRQKHN